MTAQPNNQDQVTAQPAEDKTDPLGPITFTKHSLVGARALALVGAASVLAVGVVQLTDTCSTWPTISVV